MAVSTSEPRRSTLLPWERAEGWEWVAKIRHTLRDMGWLPEIGVQLTTATGMGDWRNERGGGVAQSCWGAGITVNSLVELTDAGREDTE